MPGTVTVACRLPNGIIMRLERMEDYDEPLLAGGYKTVKRAVQRTDKPQVKLNGCAIPSSAQRIRGEHLHEIRSGAGLTYGVDADYFAEWAAQHPELTKGEHPWVFAQTKATEAGAQARDVQAVKTGFEPLNPHRMPDEFRGKIETAPRA